MVRARTVRRFGGSVQIVSSGSTPPLPASAPSPSLASTAFSTISPRPPQAAVRSRFRRAGTEPRNPISRDSGHHRRWCTRPGAAASRHRSPSRCAPGQRGLNARAQCVEYLVLFEFRGLDVLRHLLSADLEAVSPSPASSKPPSRPRHMEAETIRHVMAHRRSRPHHLRPHPTPTLRARLGQSNAFVRFRTSTVLAIPAPCRRILPRPDRIRI